MSFVKMSLSESKLIISTIDNRIKCNYDLDSDYKNRIINWAKKKLKSLLDYLHRWSFYDGYMYLSKSEKKKLMLR